MDIHDFLNAADASGLFVGVPDSKLKALCHFLLVECRPGDRHMIAANEGNAVAIAAGGYLATGRVPTVYMQNSGLGNVVNPIESLLKIYRIPCRFIVGWRGEPGLHDEPQHLYQGKDTLPQLDVLNIPFFPVGKETTAKEVARQAAEWRDRLDKGGQVAFVIRDGGLQYDGAWKTSHPYPMKRETILEHITAVSEEDILVSTTGKTSRELFEIRERTGTSHQYDFLTVGSMGHASSIAYGIALYSPERRVWCLDGDGAVLMHMGAMGVIGTSGIRNLIHVVINNGAHESVGGMPTAAGHLDLAKIAAACGYSETFTVRDFSGLDAALRAAKASGKLSFIEVKAAVGSRADLGRPTQTPLENKEALVKYLRG